MTDDTQVAAKLPQELLKALDDFDAWVNAQTLSNLPPEPSETVYHFTDVAGLVGMLNSGYMWFTERAHLNDPTELKYGIEATFKIPALSDSAPNTLPRLLSEHLREGLESSLERFGFYTASFSLNPKSLYQWRCYADNGHGVAIGVSPLIFNPSIKVDEPGIASLVQSFLVNYSSTDLHRWQKAAIDEALAILSRADLRPLLQIHHEAFIPEFMSKLGYLVLFNSLFFKHEAFEQEAEFRTLILQQQAKLNDEGLTQIRSRGREVVRYLNVPLRSFFLAEGVLREIVLGPACDLSLKTEIENALRLKGIRVPTIYKSDLPYRTAGR